MAMESIVTLPWVIPVVCGCTVAIVAIVCGVISECVKTVVQTNLKRTMVENGYTAEQIVTVLRAKKQKTDNFASETQKPSAVKGYA